MIGRREALARHAIVVLLALLLPGCTKKPEENFARYLREGKHFVSIKDYSRAILQFKNASKFKPNDAEPYYLSGLAAAATEDATSASEYLTRTIALDPRHWRAMIALSDLFTRSSYPSTVAEGRRLAQQALSIAPGNLSALNLIALADLRSGNGKTATAQLQELLRRHPEDIETAVNLARARLALDDPRGAEDLLRTAAANSTRNATALFALADFYNITGKPEEAAEWYIRGLQIQPDKGQALAALGRLHANAGRRQEADTAFARLSRNPDRRFRYAYAMRLVATGRKDAAAAEFARIFKENPEDRTARTYLIDAYLDSGRIREAEELLAKAIATDSGDVNALTQRAKVHLLRGQVESAEADINIVRHYRPEFAEGHYLAAEVHRHRQNEQLQLLELSEALRLDQHFLPARIWLARAVMRNDPHRALNIIESAPEDQRENPDLSVQRIWPLLELQRVEEARRAIDALSGCDNPEVLLQDAALRLMQGDFAAAQKSAQMALAANPAEVRALDVIMRCAAGLKQPAQGVEIVRHHAAQNPTLVGVQMFLGRIELQAGDAGRARAAFEIAKAANPAAPDPEWSLIDLDIAERKFESARSRIAPLMRGSSEATATAKLALVEQTAGNYDAASRRYRRALELKPADAGVLNNLAYLLAEFTGNPAEALRYARTAKELEPENAAVDDTLGWAYYKMSRYGDAVRYLELAVKRAPTARRNAHLAMAYARHGDRVRAKQTLRAALKMDPALPEASLAQKVIAEPSVAEIP